jgi:AcrR family transcriptional regulator
MAPTPSPVMPPTRRQRGRDAALREIKAAALDELRQHGARGVTMRGVARAIDMTPSGLYRYFDDHQALLAALCVDAHESLLATLVLAQTTHADDDTVTQWFRGSVVMRRWALGHVDEYAMVVGPRLLGIDPDHPDLLTAAARLMRVPVDTVARAVETGELVPAPPTGTVGGLASSAADRRRDVLEEARAIAIGAVSALVGAVSLEAFGPLSGADRADEYATYSLQVMRGMGWVGTSESDGLLRAAS